MTVIPYTTFSVRPILGMRNTGVIAQLRAHTHDQRPPSLHTLFTKEYALNRTGRRIPGPPKEPKIMAQYPMQNREYG